MKKSKLSIGLVASFIGALALTACETDAPAVTKSKSSIVNFVGYNGKKDKISVDVDELYREYGYTKEGTNMYYNAVLEALTRYEYPLIAKDDVTLKSYDKINSEAKDKVRAAKQTAKDNAKSNGTDYDEEWDKILKSHDVKSTKALRLKFIYELEKDALGDWYYKAHSESGEINNEHVSGLREQYIGVSEDWSEVTGKTENVDSVYPYHILHILVKLSADKDEYTRGKITQSEATKLWNVVRKLITQDYSWAEVAKDSDDSSNTSFGDVGIMSTATSFYNEFKLGIYAYDALLSGVNEPTAKNESIYDAFGIGKDYRDPSAKATVVTETLKDEGQTRKFVTDLIQKTMVSDVNDHIQKSAARTTIPTIPFDVFRRIGEVAEDEKIGTFKPEGDNVSLPRNVLFNAFLNFHSPFVITSEALNPELIDAKGNVKAEDYSFETGKSENVNIGLKIAQTNFKSTQIGGTPEDPINKDVLCDKDGNVIIGVRSEAGIHFMVMRKSVFENTNKMVGKEGTSLLDYYTTKNPVTDKAEFPFAGETYVNMKNSDDASYYTSRADTIKNDVKSSSTFDAAFDYRIYESLLDFKVQNTEGQYVTVRSILHFSDEIEVEKEDPQTGTTYTERYSKLEEDIDKMISLLRENAHENRYTSINGNWQDYLQMLTNQNNWRSEKDEYKDAFVPTTCAFSFKEGNEDMWKKDGTGAQGGLCYVEE